jgi:hypothetical protein
MTVLQDGTAVKTTQPNMTLRKEWTDAGWAQRKWDVHGVILSHSDAHGLCYLVRHSDASKAFYDPSEFEVLS